MKHPLKPLLLLLSALLLLTACSSHPGTPDGSAPSADTSAESKTEALTETETQAETETAPDAQAPDTQTPDGDTSEEATAPEEQPADRPDLCVVRDKTSDFKVIYAKSASDYIAGTAKSLRAALVRAFDMTKNPIRFATDLGTAGVVENDEYEILVGMTNRKESMEVAASLPPDSFTVTSRGNKLVILGSDDYRTALAVAYFLEHFVDTASDELIFSHDSTVTEADPMRQVDLAEGASIRIMSWNLHCPDAEDYSLFTNMLNSILYYGADIIGLQECNAAAHRSVVDVLAQKYAVATTHHSETNTYDYTPILYNPERFDLLDSGVEWLDGRYTGTNTKCISWAVLADRSNGGAKLIMINFHGAVANNSYKGMENMTKEELNAQANEWKLDNIRQVHRRIAALEEKWGKELPVFVSADYNTSKGAEPYVLMESYGYLDAEFNAVTSAVTGTKSTHTIGKKPVGGKSIDHVFYSPDRGITVYVHAFGMRQADLDATDHLPLYVDLAITP